MIDLNTGSLSETLHKTSLKAFCIKVQVIKISIIQTMLVYYSTYIFNLLTKKILPKTPKQAKKQIMQENYKTTSSLQAITTKLQIRGVLFN